jgi:hypothetical protein
MSWRCAEEGFADFMPMACRNAQKGSRGIV